MKETIKTKYFIANLIYAIKGGHIEVQVKVTEKDKSKKAFVFYINEIEKPSLRQDFYWNFEFCRNGYYDYKAVFHFENAENTKRFVKVLENRLKRLDDMQDFIISEMKKLQEAKNES